MITKKQNTELLNSTLLDISIKKQNLDIQIDDLKKFITDDNCEMILRITKQISSITTDLCICLNKKEEILKKMKTLKR